jgi:hypothetical protein
MASNWILEAANLLKDLRSSLLSRFINPLFVFFTLKVTGKRFCHCFVPANVSSAHDRSPSVVLASAAELITAKLRAMIRINHDRALGQ